MAKKVLVIDDDAVVRRMIQNSLTKNGLEVMTAADGMEGMQRLMYVAPDLIVLDVEMPRMNGYTFMMQLKDKPQYRSVPVIVLTAHADKQPIFQLRGVRDYMVKPLRPDRLMEKIRQILFPEDKTKKEKLLVIGNNATMNTLMGYYLKREGYRDIVFCEEAGEGMEKVPELRPDFVLVDPALEGADVYDLCRKIKAGEGDPPAVFFVAAREDQIDPGAVGESGAEGYAVKSEDFGSLIQLMADRSAAAAGEEGK